MCWCLRTICSSKSISKVFQLLIYLKPPTHILLLSPAGTVLFFVFFLITPLQLSANIMGVQSYSWKSGLTPPQTINSTWHSDYCMLTSTLSFYYYFTNDILNILIFWIWYGSWKQHISKWKRVYSELVSILSYHLKHWHQCLYKCWKSLNFNVLFSRFENVGLGIIQKFSISVHLSIPWLRYLLLTDSFFNYITSVTLYTQYITQLQSCSKTWQQLDKPFLLCTL